MKGFSKEYLTFLVFSLIFQSTQAQKMELSLQNAIQIALKNNTDLEINTNDIAIAKINNTKGNAGMLPRVTSTFGERLTNGNLIQKLTSGTEIRRNWFWGNNLTADVTLNYTLYDGGRSKHTLSKFGYFQKSAESVYQFNKSQIISTVTSAYFDVLRQIYQKKFLEQIISTGQERVRISKERWNAGTANKMEFLQAEIDLNIQNNNLIKQDAAITTSKLNLIRLLNEKEAKDIDIIDTAVEKILIPVTDIPATTKLQNQQALEFQQMASKEAFEEARRLHLPTVALQGGYLVGFSQSQAGLSLFNFNHGPVLGLTAAIPIYDAGLTKRQKELATIDIVQKGLQKRKLEEEQNWQYLRAKNDYVTAISQMEQEKKNSVLAEELVNIALERYRLSQASSSLELREAQKSLEDSKLRYIASVFNALITQVELYRLADKQL